MVRIESGGEVVVIMLMVVAAENHLLKTCIVIQSEWTLLGCEMRFGHLETRFQ